MGRPAILLVVGIVVFLLSLLADAFGIGEGMRTQAIRPRPVPIVNLAVISS